MPEQQFKRNTAYKLRIGNLLMGKPVMDQDKFSFLELGDKKIVRVNVVGNIVDRYDNEGEKKYVFLTLDDGSGQIKLKVFGDDAEKFKNVVQGQTVVVIGNLRNWNDETYIAPEIVKESDPKYLLLRKLETEKEVASFIPKVEREDVLAIKDKILDLIKSAEDDGGIEVSEIVKKFSDAQPSLINQEIQKLLEEGIAFEPRPGKVRWLG
ncbi:MAG: hypothetical protein KKC19_03140 [Nanoarchaeota archaeon]|nr:hypothetical protein [Nanoarchaeota archaeon]